MPPVEIFQSILVNQISTPMHTKNAKFHFIPCANHTIQLRIRYSLNDTQLQSILASFRQTCRLFTKSPSGALTLEGKKFQVGSQPLRLLLDVNTRCSSTFVMLERFLKLKKFIDRSVQEMFSEKYSFGALKPGVQLTSGETAVLGHV